MTLNFRSPKEILTSEKIIVIFSDVCAAVRVYLGCRCLAVCLRRCILVEEWVSGPVCFHEPTDRQMSKTGLTRVLKHQAGETSNGGQLKHRCKVQPPSANLHNNQTWKLVQSVNQPLPDRNLRSEDYSASLISQTLANAVWRAVCTDFGWKIHAGHLMLHWIFLNTEAPRAAELNWLGPSESREVRPLVVSNSNTDLKYVKHRNISATKDKKGRVGDFWSGLPLLYDTVVSAESMELITSWHE